MAALPFRFTGEEALLAPPQATPAIATRELTIRAVLTGAVIGVLLAAGNVYTGLKTGFIDPGALTATLVSFAVFASVRRFGARAFTRLENNVAQTVAASAAVMGFVHGLMGPIPALAMMGTEYAAWALWAWGLSLGILGIVVAAWARQRLILEESLPFPSGAATAELLKTLHVDRASAARPIRLLLLGLAASALVTWLRDGAGAYLPGAVYLPVALAGIPASALTLGIGVTPLMAATGIFVGLRGALSLFGAGLFAWTVMAPLLVRGHVVTDASYTSLVSWLVWPAFGLMFGGSVAPLVAAARRHGRFVWRALHEARTTFAAGDGPEAIPVSVGKVRVAWCSWSCSASYRRAIIRAVLRKAGCCVGLLTRSP